jgi:hypothetical protein
MADLPSAIALLKANGDVIKIALSLLGAVGAVLFFFWRQVVGTSIHVKDRYVNRLQVCVISDTSARRLDDFIELYQEIFSSEERVSTKEIHDWLEWKAHKEGIQYRLYLAMKDSKPAAVAISFFQSSTKMLFIPYMGISGLDGSWATSRRIVRAMVRAVSREARNWTAGLVEIADPEEPNLPFDEVRRRRARIKRLASFAARENLGMLQVDLPYAQPSFANDVDQLDLCGMLLFVLLREKRATSLPREVVIQALEFIYHRIYRASFSGSAEAAAAYELDLRSRITSFTESLGEAVMLRG